MTTKTTYFSDTVSDSAGDFLWSNAANWSNGKPANGDTVDLLQTTSVDDIPDLALGALASNVPGDPAATYVASVIVSANLYVAQGYLAATNVTVQAGAGAGRVTVTIGMIMSGSDAVFTANGASATFIDDSPTTFEGQFVAEDGGTVELAAAPAALSTFTYDDQPGSGKSVFAFEAPATTNTAWINNFRLDDILELPGTSVSAVTFGAASLSVTTSSGTYAFTNFDDEQVPKGYTAAVDPVTGLVAFTFNDVNTFQQDDAAASGTLSGDYLWSNAANWTGGLPANGSGFTVGTVGYDDIAALRLVDLTLDKTGDEPEVFVTGGTLAVADLLETGSGGSALLEADAMDAGAPVSVTLDANDSHGALFEANGASARFLDQSTTGLIASDYAVDNGGLVEVLSTPLFTDVFSYLSNGTFAFEAPAAVNIFLVESLDYGDTIEVPGTSLSSVTFGTDSLRITTDAGSYAFDSVVYATTLTNDVATYDPTTGLEAIAFRGVNTFTPAVRANPGQTGYAQYLWSNAANWTEGAPVTGDSLLTTYTSATEYELGVDDFPVLTLSGLNLALANLVQVEGNLTVSTVTENYEGLIKVDSGTAGTPAILTIGTLTGSFYDNSIFADGPGAVVVDQSTTDVTGPYGSTIAYYVSAGGEFELLAARPADTTQLIFDDNDGADVGGQGTIALGNPGPTNGVALERVGAGDVLELPGISVSAATFGATSLSITTDAGIYAFTNVTYANTPTGYTAAPDPSTGLVAITFTGPDVFEANAKAFSDTYSDYYDWSNAANWSDGVPIDGDEVQVTPSSASRAVAYDDLTSLTLSSLMLNGNGNVEVGGKSLTVGMVSSTGLSFLNANSGFSLAPVTVTIDTLTGAGGGFYGAVGAGASFVDLSGTDPGEFYHAVDGGFLELSAPLSSASALAYADETNTLANTIALAHLPAGTYGAALGGVLPHDVLELPGSSVSAVTFGTTSLSVTTNDGTYTFSNVTYAGSITGYTAAPDPSTGLEAITFTGPDVFEDNVKAFSDTYSDYYDWSNAANWSDGEPIDGDEVQVTPSSASRAVAYDDLTSLTLSSLMLNGNGNVEVGGKSLTIGMVSSTGTSFLNANSGFSLAPVTVTIDTLTGAGGGFYGAVGAGASFVDLSGTDPGEFYHAADGGFLELSAPLSSASALAYADETNTLANTIALAHLPAGTYGAALGGVLPHDVLELPGSSVSAVTFGTTSLSVTTNDGTYTFSNVTYAGSITGYTAAPDPSTGLEAITFTGPDVFEDNVKAFSDTYSDYYDWSNAANWSDGEPIDGDEVQVTPSSASRAVAYDDLTSLTLSSLMLNGNGNVEVGGKSLTIGMVSSTGTSFLNANSRFSLAPVTVTIDTLTGAGGGFYGAVGAGASFVDLSGTDPGEFYHAADGGFLELSAPLSSASALAYADETNTLANTIALAHLPAGTYGAALGGVLPHDVLELPGSSVSAVTFGTTSLSVTTNDGTYTFSNVTYANPVISYTAAPDPTTGLVAITFVGLDTFEANVKVTSGPFKGYYLWSNAANWSLGAPPIDGDSVSVTAGAVQQITVDDIAALSLATLTMTGTAIVVAVANSLAVATVSATSGTYLEVNSTYLHTPVTATVGTLTAAGGRYQVFGAGAIFDDQSATDPGEYYGTLGGGLTEISAAPASSSRINYLLGRGTFAIVNPVATSAVDFTGIDPGDVLELPGTSVSNVDFGATSLSVTTNAGTYAFTNVTYTDPITGYTAAPDPATGLEAVTFVQLDTFEHTVAASSGVRTGHYLWSNPANWNLNLPTTVGVTVASAVSGYDDISGLTLTALSQAAASFTEIIADLTVGSVMNDGVLRVDDQAVLKITGSLTGSGVLTQDPSTIELDGPVSADQTVDLVGSGNLLILGDPQDFKATIDGFNSGDVIDLEGFSSSDIISKSFVDNILTLVESGGSIALTFANSPDPSIANFTVQPGTGTTITANGAPCFAAGTRIMTPRGELPVEDLIVGELVHTEFTGTAAIRWIGRRHVDCRGHPKPKQVWPVRIAVGAFGSNTPRRDLWLSPDHAVYVQGVLIPIKRLINGTSVMQDPMDKVTYYHVELPEHDVVLAEGLPVESYLDADDRSSFDNDDGVMRLFPDFSSRRLDVARLWEACGCAPLIVYGPEIDAARAFVNAQATAPVHAAVWQTFGAAEG